MIPTRTYTPVLTHYLMTVQKTKTLFIKRTYKKSKEVKNKKGNRKNGKIAK